MLHRYCENDFPVPVISVSHLKYTGITSAHFYPFVLMQVTSINTYVSTLCQNIGVIILAGDLFNIL